MTCAASVEKLLASEHVEAITAAGFTPADVIAWIQAHTGQGVTLFRMLLPLLVKDPKLVAAITAILDILFPTPAPTV